MFLSMELLVQRFNQSGPICIKLQLLKETKMRFNIHNQNILL